MSDKPLLWSLPCEDCHGNKYIDGDPPDYRCVESPTGDYECRDVQAAMRIAGYAREIAVMLESETDIALKFSLASDIADALDSALYYWAAELDKGAFMAACGVSGGD